MARIFLVLGILWLLTSVYQFLTMAGQPDRSQVALSFLGMAGANLGASWVLTWLRERRRRTGSGSE